MRSWSVGVVRRSGRSHSTSVRPKRRADFLILESSFGPLAPRKLPRRSQRLTTRIGESVSAPGRAMGLSNPHSRYSITDNLRRYVSTKSACMCPGANWPETVPRPSEDLKPLSSSSYSLLRTQKSESRRTECTPVEGAPCSGLPPSSVVLPQV